MNYRNNLMPVPDNSYNMAPWQNSNTMYYNNNNSAFDMPNQYSYDQNCDTDIHWVQGLAGAKAFYVPRNKTIILMDSEANKFYIKSSNQYGMPMPLKIFRYTEEAAEPESQYSNSPDTNKYLTKEDLEKMLDERLGKK